MIPKPEKTTSVEPDAESVEPDAELAEIIRNAELAPALAIITHFVLEKNGFPTVDLSDHDPDIKAAKTRYNQLKEAGNLEAVYAVLNPQHSSRRGPTT